MGIAMGIGGKTRLTGLIGWPVSHSLSPAMHNAAAAALGIDWVYLPLPVRPADLEAAVRGLSALGFAGVNVTIPHKKTVVAYLDELDNTAQAIGAVNTILVQPGDERIRLTGYNTDAAGFLADLAKHGVDITGRDCLILGAGGSARAVAYALATEGGRVQVLARREKQARQLVADLAPHLFTKKLPDRPVPVPLKARSLPELPLAAHQTTAALIVNTTPVGMPPDLDQSIWPDGLVFPAGAFVYDLVYNPAETKLIRQALSSGCRATNGLGMLVHQGALSFQLWTGHKPDVSRMTAAISE
jgi:shikimate dehydrogenase